MNKQKCILEDCETTRYRRGLCVKHYSACRRDGTIEEFGLPTTRVTVRARAEGMCNEEGCDKKKYARGLCNKHYDRNRKAGNLDAFDLTPSYKKRTTIDTRYKLKEGYIGMVVDGRYITEHRYVMEQHLGRKLVAGENVHHKNGFRDDNRIENLELWYVSQPAGQRADDLVDYVASTHKHAVQVQIMCTPIPTAPWNLKQAKPSEMV